MNTITFEQAFAASTTTGAYLAAMSDLGPLLAVEDLGVGEHLTAQALERFWHVLGLDGTSPRYTWAADLTDEEWLTWMDASARDVLEDAAVLAAIIAAPTPAAFGAWLAAQEDVSFWCLSEVDPSEAWRQGVIECCGQVNNWRSWVITSLGGTITQ